jgi:hypothetical protein
VLDQLHQAGCLRGEPRLVRLMIFGALNWSVQWYQPPGRGKSRQRATLDDLTHTAIELFLSPP